MQATVIPILPSIELKRILFATDFLEASRAALPVAFAIARRYGSTVYAVHIREPLPQSMLATPEAESILTKQEERDILQELQKEVDTIAPKDASVVLISKCGDVARELEDIVRKYNVDLAILGTHGRKGFQRLMMGSVAEAVFRNLPCPVLTVGPRAGKQLSDRSALKNILFPTDLSRESKAAFPYIASLAAEYAAHLTVLHVLPLETGANPDVKVLAEPLRREMQDMFGSQISPRSTAEFILDCGNTSERILAHAKERNADLIGLGVRRTGDLSTHFRHTIAYQVVVSAECPVLAAHF